MRRVLVAVLALLAAAPAAAAASPPCAPGSPAQAALTLHGRGTEVGVKETIAGLPTALALVPHLSPGTRHRLIAVPGGWCDAQSGFNAAWSARELPVGDGRAMATAFARLAAAPWFDDTTVRSATSAGGVHTIETHSRTNGITARWVVRTDATGVRSATWTSTGLGVAPAEPQLEGLTAFPGRTETYRRQDDGRLAADRGLPTRATMDVHAPGPALEHVTADGFTIKVVAADSRQGADIGQDTGVHRVDVATLRAVRRAFADAYETFHGWGMRADWAPAVTRVARTGSPVQLPAEPRTGYVYVHDTGSAACFACVAFPADDFEVHLAANVLEEYLALAGVTYPEGREQDLLELVAGHEVFHLWQMSAVKPIATGRNLPIAYVEGTARFQETLHGHSDISHQPASMVYLNDESGCNGAFPEPPDAAIARGPFNTASGWYTSCQFWLPWYTTGGPDAFVRLVTTGIPAAVEPDRALDGPGQIVAALETATGRPYVEHAAGWIRGAITHEDMVFGPLAGGAPALDWSRHFERWVPTMLAVGAASTRVLADGGAMAHEVTAAFRPHVRGAARLVVVRDTPSGSQTTFPAYGDLVHGPAAGERLYLAAVLPRQGFSTVTLTVGAP